MTTDPDRGEAGATGVNDAITDVAGIRVGHHNRIGAGWLTGVTVVLPPPGTIAGVDVRGGGPGTLETDALRPGTLVSTADAVVLTGGSAYGLITAHGVQRWCEDHDRGFPIGDVCRVPVVPGAVIFDLGRGGDYTARPEEAWGYQAAEDADHSGDHAPVARGSVGAGTGALTAAGRLKGGVGTASTRLTLAEQQVTVAALAVVNARGTPQLPGLPELLSPRPTGDGLNTTLVVVATDAALDVAEVTRTAGCGHDGLARALDPVHTLSDGDTVFGLATGGVALPEDPAAGVEALVQIQAAAATVVQWAVLDGVGSAATVATAAGRFPGYATLADEPPVRDGPSTDD
jgi:L-aminopeptidase/D-esterase-like protein